MLLITLHVFSALGTVDITKRFNLKKETDLEILGVKEEDAGPFTCVVDEKSHEHTLLVVSGEQTTQEKYLQIILNSAWIKLSAVYHHNYDFESEIMEGHIEFMTIW